MGLVLVAEILVLIPNIARDRQVILREKTLEAYIAALSAAAPTDAPALAQRDELLRASGIDAIRMRDPRGTTLVLAGDPMAQPAKTFDLRQETSFQSLIRGLVAATATEDMLVEIIADTPFKPGTEIEFIMHRAPLSQALRELDGPDAWMTLMVASMVGLILYLALLALLVRPMRRLTASIAAFRADPEHGVPLDLRAMTARRDDEISVAGRELAAMQRELRAALWRNSRLAALGTVVAKVSHDVRGVLTPVLLQADRLGKHADPAVRRAGDALVQAVERAIDLVHRTLDFARDGPPPPLLGRIRLRALVTEAAESVRGAVPCSSSTTVSRRTRRSRPIGTICSACWRTCCATPRRPGPARCARARGRMATCWRSSWRTTGRGCRTPCAPTCSARSPVPTGPAARASAWRSRAT
jgi:hypothetical protein